jgi:hypothetical protein
VTELTANQVALHLAQLARDLDALVSTMDTAEVDAVNLREDFTMAYAKSFLTADGSMDIRRHKATEDTHEPRLKAELAEQHVKAIRRQIDSVKIRIDVGRSMGAAIRSETALAGYQP